DRDGGELPQGQEARSTLRGDADRPVRRQGHLCRRSGRHRLQGCRADRRDSAVGNREDRVRQVGGGGEGADRSHQRPDGQGLISARGPEMRRLPMVAAALWAVLGAHPAAAQLTVGRPFDDTPLGDRPKFTDPEAHDAVELFSHLCLSTRGDRGRVINIIGNGDPTIEKLDDRTVLQLQNGRPGGIGWAIRMPLGEKLVLEIAGSGTCIVRAPRVEGESLERGLENLLAEIGSSDRFNIRRAGDDTKTVGKRKYHFVAYDMSLPDTGQTAEIGVATTDAKDAPIQGSLT